MRWTAPDRFEIDGARFLIDATVGGDGAKTNADEFVIVKYPSFLERYVNLRHSGCHNVLELGVFEGGSVVFLDKILKPNKLSAVDLMDIPRPFLDDYVSKASNQIRVHCPVSQADEVAITRIIDDDFGGELDLVIDDASHYYEETRNSFLTVFPRLRPGGLYIIEDWGWSYHQPFQGDAAPWQDKKALVNFVFELLEELSVNNSLHDLTITPDMVMIRKPLTAPHAPLLTKHGRRGRILGEL